MPRLKMRNAEKRKQVEERKAWMPGGWEAGKLGCQEAGRPGSLDA